MAAAGPPCTPLEVTAWPAQALALGPTTLLGVRNLGGPVTLLPSKREPLYKPLGAFRGGAGSGLKPTRSAAQLNDDEEPGMVPFAPSRVYLCVGLFMLGMLVLLPVWNAIALKNNEAFLFFLGHAFPDLILWICLPILGLYALTICCLARASPSSFRSDDTMMTVGSCFVTLLGLALLAVSSPMTTAVQAVTHDIWSNCRFGASTRELFEASASLQTLRARPACDEEESIEQCAGYVETPAASALKAMEREWRCSGFCYTPPSAGSDSAASALRVALNLPSCQAGAPPPCETLPYPHSLFSLEDRHLSCDGVAAREINSFGKEVAEQLFVQGVMLVLVPVLVGFLRLFGQPRSGVDRAQGGVRLRHDNRPLHRYGATHSQPALPCVA